MLLGQKGVKYGLQVRAPPGAKPGAKAAPAKKRSVFGDDESDDDAEDNVEQQIARQAARKLTDKKVAEMHAAALAEDAAIFDYDSHYDTIQEARAEPRKQEKLQRQSRYIAGLLEKAEERKQEQDVLYERQLAKERAAEDHLFGDKEKFVTAAYRAKLAERQAYVEEQKRKKAAEEADSVEKRGHMGDFYRNLLRSNMAFGCKAAEEKQQNKEEPPQQQDRGGREARQGPRQPAEAGQAQREMEEVMAREAAAVGLKRGRSPAAAAERTHQEQQQQEQRGEPAAPAAAAGAATTDEGASEEAAAAVEAGKRRNKEDAVAAARERYLTRKRQKTGTA